MFTRELVQQLTRLEPTDIAFLVTTVLDGPPKGAVTEGEFLLLLLYDILKSHGLRQEHLVALLKHYRRPVLEWVKDMVAAKKPVPAMALVIADGRYAGLTNEEEVFDFTELETVAQIPVPVVSLSVVLPTLYWRAVEAAQALSDRPPAGAGSSPAAAARPTV